MIELTSPVEIEPLKLQWQLEQEQRRTKTKPGYEYTESNKLNRARIADDYKQSEEKRQAKISAAKERAAVARAAKERKENERWERIWKEKKIEDPNYYAR